VGVGAAAVVQRERHGSRIEDPPRRRGGRRMAAAGRKGFRDQAEGRDPA
jgi:hypothetical protein